MAEPVTPAIDARLTRAFIEQTIKVLECVDTELLAEHDMRGGGATADDYRGVRGFFDNALKTFKLRDEAERIENALRNAR